MTFNFTRILNHGTSNPIVARLDGQIFEILKFCKIEESKAGKIQKIYTDELMPRLIRVYEIKEKYRFEFNKQLEAYDKQMENYQPNKPMFLPYIVGIEQDCHNVLYEFKNFVRAWLRVINTLYETSFENASQYCALGKKEKSEVVEFFEQTFGVDDNKTQFLKEGVDLVTSYIKMRNAVEHPGKRSGELKISNFIQGPDKIVDEPCWWREESSGSPIDKSSIRVGFEEMIDILLTLGEDIFICWANENLIIPKILTIELIPKDKRNPEHPIKYKVGLRSPLETLQNQTAELNLKA